MQHYLLVFFALIFIYFNQVTISKEPKTYIPLKLSEYNKQGGLYQATITGNKKFISNHTKAALKKLGLLHLFTPSGLHLSSLFFLRFLPTGVLVIILGLIFLYISDFNTYHSMERVILFKVIHYLGNFKLEKCFLLTFVVSLLFDHLSNPLSYLFSFIFWGTILIYRDNPVKCSFYLSMHNVLISSLLSQPINLLIFILNPLITLTVSSLFPFLFLNSLLPEEYEVSMSWFFNMIENIVASSNSILTVNISFSIAVLFFILFKTRNKYLLAIAILIPTSLDGRFQPSEFRNQVINFSRKEEILKTSKTKIDFIDRTCSLNYKCRLKEIWWGGIEI